MKNQQAAGASAEAALRREAEEEAEAAGVPWDDYTGVREMEPTIMSYGYGMSRCARRDPV